MASNVNTHRLSNYCFKLILLGDYNVGKTSMFCRFKNAEFKEDTKLTVGADNHTKVIEVDQQNVTVSLCTLKSSIQFEEIFVSYLSYVLRVFLVLWDTVGTERFRTLTRNYFRNADACLLVFSGNEPDTLTSLTQWVADADNFAENALKVLVANKSDLTCRTSQEKVKAFAQHHDCDIVFNVSAKTGEGLDDMFKTVAQKLISRNSRVRNNQSLFEQDVHLLESQETKLSCC